MGSGIPVVGSTVGVIGSAAEIIKLESVEYGSGNSDLGSGGDYGLKKLENVVNFENNINFKYQSVQTNQEKKEKKKNRSKEQKTPYSHQSYFDTVGKATLFSQNTNQFNVQSKYVFTVNQEKYVPQLQYNSQKGKIEPTLSQILMKDAKQIQRYPNSLIQNNITEHINFRRQQYYGAQDSEERQNWYSYDQYGEQKYDKLSKQKRNKVNY